MIELTVVKCVYSMTIDHLERTKLFDEVDVLNAWVYIIVDFFISRQCSFICNTYHIVMSTSDFV